MMLTKYVRFERAGFVLFDACSMLSHKHVAESVLHNALNDGDRVISAGFVAFDMTTCAPHCSGLSSSLDMGAGPGDSQALARQLGLPMRRDTAAQPRVPS